MSHITPQPWTRDKHGIYGPDGEKIQVAGVSLVLNGTAAEKAEAEANRDLLFAAPSMLNALTKILAGLRSRKGTVGEGKLSISEMMAMKKAIEEATGEKP